MKQVYTWESKIYSGLKITNSEKSFVYSLDHAASLVQHYVDRVGQCFTVTPTEYVYTNGSEPGIIVGSINYPRFPSSQDKLRAQTLELAKILLDGLKQQKVSVVFADMTIMLEAGID